MNTVIGMDGSKYSAWALEWLGTLPFRTKPRVTAVHVMDLQSVRPSFLVHPVVSGYEPDVGEALHHLESRANQVEKDTKQRLAKLGLKGSVHVEKDKIAESLFKHAGHAELMVVGSRGLNAIDRAVLGSVSSTVTLHATCPVLIVKEPSHPIRRILIATDGSPASSKVLQFITKQFSVKSTTVPVVALLVHVMPFLRYTMLQEAGEQLLAREAASLEKVGYRVRRFPRVGPVAEEILAVANHEQPDMIVIGAKGQSAVARFLQGSVSTKVSQQSACSVLIVK